MVCVTVWAETKALEWRAVCVCVCVCVRDVCECIPRGVGGERHA